MEDKGKDQFTDELLEASLRRYQSEDPRAGLEGRILARVSASERAAQRWIWVWALGAAAGVGLIFAIFQLRQRPAPAPSPQQVVVEETAPFVIPSPATLSISPKPSLQAARRPVRHAARTDERLSRPPQFPTPAPLSEEERLLLAYVAAARKSAEATTRTDSLVIERLEIPKIKIAKIEFATLPEISENAKEEP